MQRTRSSSKSVSIFMPKSHKSSHRFIIDSVCPTLTVNKHANPNRARVIALDSEFELTPTTMSTASRKRRKQKSAESEGSESNLEMKRRKTSESDSDESSTPSSPPSEKVADPQDILDFVVYGEELNTPIKPLPLAPHHSRAKTSLNTDGSASPTSDESESPFGDVFLHPEPWRRIDEILGFGTADETAKLSDRTSSPFPIQGQIDEQPANPKPSMHDSIDDFGEGACLPSSDVAAESDF